MDQETVINKKTEGLLDQPQGAGSDYLDFLWEQSIESRKKSFSPQEEEVLAKHMASAPTDGEAAHIRTQANLLF
ncbi:hypothetical protein [Eisenibacter elegans]|jgi:hypothetical protein|uniref:hypothetical protein n=1 Tax=Eisenibacter elegans TaxID=997 RepID=UPI000409D6F0|nr:hypothetical protein [Eisenibacter elegans]